MHRILLLVMLVNLQAHADDNRIAHRLFTQERFAEAAEIFTDPAWKGVALYRSSQWWRAAEAFVRADQPDAYFNLGNTYVRLGYYALALDAYVAAQALRPGFEDAAFNAELMRKLLAKQNEDNNSDASLQPRSDAIDRVDAEADESGNSADDPDKNSAGEEEKNQDREGATDNRGPSPTAIAAGDSAEAGSDETLNDDGSSEGGSVKGSEAQNPVSQNNPSGGSEGKETTADAQAAAVRAHLEREQATEQWLNQIQHNPLKYLKKRIELETARRRAAGEAAPEGGSPW